MKWPFLNEGIEIARTYFTQTIFIKKIQICIKRVRADKRAVS